MTMIDLVLLIGSLICFFLAALNIPSPRANLIASGLALWVLSMLVP